MVIDEQNFPEGNSARSNLGNQRRDIFLFVQSRNDDRDGVGWSGQIGHCEGRADDGIRTRDLRFTKPLLYQLSYVGAERANIASVDRASKRVATQSLPASLELHL